MSVDEQPAPDVRSDPLDQLEDVVDNIIDNIIDNVVENVVESIVEDLEEAMLSPLEARILGALMEKQLTTPDLYPLSLNSLVLACNQKTSREPLMKLENGAVQRCLYQLQDKNLVEFDYGARADKFKQRLSRVLHLDSAEHAVFCLLLLRGPQTLNELLSRSRRMHEFSGEAELTELLESHLTKLKPMLLRIAPQVGQREERYTHLLCGQPDLGQFQNEAAQGGADSVSLKARVEALEKQVAWLMAQLPAGSEGE